MITGNLLSGRYLVGDVVGQGTTSVVLRCHDQRLDRDVAVKVLRTELASDPTALRRFRREAGNAATLSHPAIVAVYDTGEAGADGGTVPFMVTEYVDGQTVQELLAGGDPFPAIRALGVAADVTAALEFAHRHGVLHRHLSPATVMIDSTGAVKVMDFDAAGESGDARSDVRGVGDLLQQMLAGTSEPAVEADAVVRTALQADPLDRYQSATELQSALQRALAAQRAPADPPADAAGGAAVIGTASQGHPATAPLLAPPAPLTRVVYPPPPAPPPDRPTQRRWGIIGIAALCGVILLGAGWLTLQVVTTAPPAAPVAVPDLTGQTLAQAQASLTANKLTLGEIAKVESAQSATGKVVSQRPSGRTEVVAGTVVDLEVGRGITRVVVPDLIGSTAATAQKAVLGAHLKYAEHKKTSSDADRGRVLTQSTAAQKVVKPGTMITVTIGTGQLMVAVPGNVIGQDIHQATRILKAAGLTVVAQPADGAEPVNQVIGMDQQPGKRLPQGTPVMVSTSNNTLMVMPELAGQSPDQAAGTLRNAGWAGDLGSLAQVGTPTPNRTLVGAVVEQNPAAGAVVRKIGTPVRVGVGVRQVTVPNVVGKSQKAAAQLLSKAGATNVAFADAGKGPRGQAGKVKSQSPAAGSAVAADTPITVQVYSG